MTVPPRHERHAEIAHRVELRDDVLQDLVQADADVHLTRRVGRPVVDDERLGVAAILENSAVEVLRLPPRKHLVLAVEEIAAHGKRRDRHVYRVSIVGHRLSNIQLWEQTLM
jgi:hypothetical protein